MKVDAPAGLQVLFNTAPYEVHLVSPRLRPMRGTAGCGVAWLPGLRPSRCAPRSCLPGCIPLHTRAHGPLGVRTRVREWELQGCARGGQQARLCLCVAT